MEQLYRETWIQVNTEAIKQNVASLDRLHNGDRKIMAVVKANGYGHGAIEVAKAALVGGATVLGTALLEEAIELREAGIVAPIVVLGRTAASGAGVAAKLDIALTTFQREWLVSAMEHLERGQSLKLHVKYDTGMGRIGVRTIEEVKEVLTTIDEEESLELEGLFTHFATADELDLSYYEEQQKTFDELIRVLTSEDRHIPLIHCANSAASMRFKDACYNMVRFGISMYGLLPATDLEAELPFSLAPALSLYSHLSHVKPVKSGSKISYGGTYTATQDEWIGTVPIGYGDGWIRSNANGGEVIIDGMRLPIVGRICMDQMMVRLPHEMSVGQRVTLIGEDNNERITIEEVADRLGTITYEIPCLITKRVPRLYVEKTMS
ncbi:alanine racemase [Bacillaceae bacterium JMAK1]|nr:alanine racemase [Bacillaceae bacterium JMAK1]